MPTIPHILFVDDDADTREMIRIALQLAGFRVSVIVDTGEVCSYWQRTISMLCCWITGCRKLTESSSAGKYDRSTQALRSSSSLVQLVTLTNKPDSLLARKATSPKPTDPDDLVSSLRAALPTTAKR